MKVCPNCKKAGIEFFIGGQTGSYRCNNCGYIGPIIVEVEKIRRTSNKKKKNYK